MTPKRQIYNVFPHYQLMLVSFFSLVLVPAFTVINTIVFVLLVLYLPAVVSSVNETNVVLPWLIITMFEVFVVHDRLRYNIRLPELQLRLSFMLIAVGSVLSYLFTFYWIRGSW
jgi:hypothetical protein